MNSGWVVVGCVAVAISSATMKADAQTPAARATQSPAGVWIVPSAVDSEISETGLSGAALADYAVWLKDERTPAPTMAKVRDGRGQHNVTVASLPPSASETR